MKFHEFISATINVLKRCSDDCSTSILGVHDFSVLFPKFLFLLWFLAERRHFHSITQPFPTTISQFATLTLHSSLVIHRVWIKGVPILSLTRVMYGMQWKSEYLPKKKFLGCGGAGFVLFAEWRYHTRYLFYMYALIRTGLVSSTIFDVLESSTVMSWYHQLFLSCKVTATVGNTVIGTLVCISVPSAWLTAWILSLLGLFQGVWRNQ